jgi:hypothetical protein
MVEEYHRLVGQVINPYEDPEVRRVAAKTMLDKAFSYAEFDDMTLEEIQSRLALVKAELAARGEPVD